MVPGEDGGVATKPLSPATLMPMVADSLTAPSAHPEWASAMQALHGGGPAAPRTPAFRPLSSSSSYPSPYMWVNQSVIPGAPIAYTSLYPNVSVYAHPATSLPMGPNMATRETKSNPSEGSDQSLKKTSDDSSETAGPVTGNCGDGDKATSSSVNVDPLGNASLLTGSCGDGDKATSGSVNVDPSHSEESGGEEFSKNSKDDEIDPCDLSTFGKRSYDRMFSASVNVAPDLPTTSLSKGMDLWNSSHVNGGQNTVGISPGSQTTVNGLSKAVPENQDEHEQKRQRRKLSNRESARRSRERKQKECEDLARQVAELNTQNGDLRAEIDKLNSECKKLEAESTLIAEELKQLYGPSVLAPIEGERLSMPAIRILGVECNGHSPEGSNLVPKVYHNTILLPTSNGEAQGHS